MVTAEKLVANLRARGIRIWFEGDLVSVEPCDQLTIAEEQAIPTLKPAILALLRAESARRAVVPNSRAPLITDDVRAKIAAIEADARAKGWPAELLWNSVFWGSPRGLAAVLKPEDEILEVTDTCITIRTCRRDIQRFHRYVA